MAKLFESIPHKQILAQIKSYISDSHSFRPNRSAETNLLTVVYQISKHLDKGIQVDVIYFDFKKVFDRVDIDILLNKLFQISFSPKLLKLFANYLCDRQQYVKHGCLVSKPYNTRSGVSQGSILGPLLFTVTINVLELVLNVPTLCWWS